MSGKEGGRDNERSEFEVSEFLFFQDVDVGGGEG